MNDGVFAGAGLLQGAAGDEWQVKITDIVHPSGHRLPRFAQERVIGIGLQASLGRAAINMHKESPDRGWVETKVAAGIGGRRPVAAIYRNLHPQQGQIHRL